jgi:hypothetical protein
MGKLTPTKTKKLVKVGMFYISYILDFKTIIAPNG